MEVVEEEVEVEEEELLSGMVEVVEALALSWD